MTYHIVAELIKNSMELNNTWEFPISKIDNIEVNVYLKKYIDYISIHIDHKTYISFNKTIYAGINPTILDYQEILIKCNDIFDSIRFNKLEGEFIFNDIINLADVYKQVFTSPTISFNFDNCCICHEPTKCKTICKHYLCVYCSDNIREFNNIKPCPICRCQIY